jgi:hypothetical protein
MKSVIVTANQGNYFTLAIYYGIDALARLCKTGTFAQRRALTKQILEHDLLPIIYDVRRAACFVWSANKKPVL